MAGVACSTATLHPTSDVSAGPTVWWRNGVCYEVFVRSFYDSDGNGIGDLKGLIARLDYINDGNLTSTKSLGATCIWLMPIDKSHSYHGYDVTDYYHVDPQYGTDDDFRALVSEAHRRGIRVIVDFVPNHSSSYHPFFQAALKDPASPYRSWYRFSTTRPTQRGPWGQEAWHKSPLRDEYYYGVFWHEMPDWNYETPAVLDEMLKVTSYWLTTMKADGFRFDAIPYLVEDGNALQHARGTHEVLKRFGNAIRAQSPQSFTIGEESDVSALPTYYPDQLDSYFEFGVAAATLESARTGTAAAFLTAVNHANSMLPVGRWSPFLTNHDQPRVMEVLNHEMSRARLAATAMLMLPGMPFVYYGEEIGMLGTKPDETIRTPMQWSSAGNGGFTNGKPWEPLQSDWMTKNVAGEDADSASLLNHYRRLIHLRNGHVALSRGQLRVESTNNAATAAFVRQTTEETILVVVNFGDVAVSRLASAMNAALSGARLFELYGDPQGGCGAATVAGDRQTVMIASIAGHGACIYQATK
jgi:glycosidase